MGLDQRLLTISVSAAEDIFNEEAIIPYEQVPFGKWSGDGVWEGRSRTLQNAVDAFCRETYGVEKATYHYVVVTIEMLTYIHKALGEQFLPLKQEELGIATPARAFEALGKAIEELYFSDSRVLIFESDD